MPLASALAISPASERDPTLFACGGDGLYRSLDFGESWQRVLIGNGLLSVAAAIGEPDPGPVVLVGTETDGIVRSEDGGRTWTGGNPGLLDLTAISLAVSPRFVFDRTAFAGTASGLYRTRNGGKSWRSVETGLDDAAIQCVLVSPAFADDHLVLAGTESDGLLRSVDGGLSWESPPTLSSGSVTALAGANGTLAAATERGIVLSRDEGRTWHPVERGPRDPILSLAFQGDDLLAGVHRQGVVRSLDGGVTWQPAQEGLSARIDTRLVFSAEFERDRTVFVCGPDEGVRASTDGGITWEQRTAGLVDVAVNDLCTTSGGLWAAAGDGVYVTSDRASTWHRSTTGAGSARFVAAASSIVAAAFDDGRLAVSDNEGATWRDLRLPTEACGVMALAVGRDGAVWVVTSAAAELTLWRWDEHRRWSRFLVETSPALMRVGLAVSSSDPVLLGLGHRVLRPLAHAHAAIDGERRPVWRSASLGSETLNVTSLAVSPVDRKVFAATNAGVFVSRQGGEPFVDWSDGLTDPRMVTVAVSPRYDVDRLVYALSLGGSVWRRVGP